MATLKYVFFLLFVPFVLIAQEVPEAPNPARLVNDYVGMLSDAEKGLLEQKLVSMDDSTSTQITVVVIPTVEPSYDMNSYSVALGRKWGVGQKGKNNGIIILWATDDRKVYIATGYGVEGGLPDAYAKRVVDQIIIPNFKEGQFYAGLDQGTTAIMKYVSGEFEAEPADAEDFPLWVFILMLIIIYFIFRAITKNGGNNRGGGMRNDRAWPYTTYTGWGGHSGSWSSGGGGWSGGSGGGFGGFGGGSFGGGGAGGSY